MKKPSDYKLRKKIKELEREVKRLAPYRTVVMNLFDILCACKDNSYYTPLSLITYMKQCFK